VPPGQTDLCAIPGNLQKSSVLLDAIAAASNSVYLKPRVIRKYSYTVGQRLITSSNICTVPSKRKLFISIRLLKSISLHDRGKNTIKYRHIFYLRRRGSLSALENGV